MCSDMLPDKSSADGFVAENYGMFILAPRAPAFPLREKQEAQQHTLGVLPVLSLRVISSGFVNVMVCVLVSGKT